MEYLQDFYIEFPLKSVRNKQKVKSGSLLGDDINYQIKKITYPVKTGVLLFQDLETRLQP